MHSSSAKQSIGNHILLFAQCFQNDRDFEEQDYSGIKIFKKAESVHVKIMYAFKD